MSLYVDEHWIKLGEKIQKEAEEKHELQIKLQMADADERAKERIKKAEERVKAQKYEPTWDEVWVTGYTTNTMKFKKGIFQTKLSDSDKKKLLEVKEATESGEIPTGVESLKKYTKTHALRMYKELQLVRREAIIEELMAHMPSNYHLINEIEPFEKLLRDLWQEDEFAIDTETTGLNYFHTYEAPVDKIVGISISLPKADYHVYIPINHTSGKQLPEKYVLDGLKPILEEPSIKKILFNAKFDIHMLRRHGLHLKGFWFDGFIGMKLLNEGEESYKLKSLATKYGKFFGFNDPSQTYEELFGDGGYQDAEFERDGKPWIGTYYPCKDTHLTYKFYKDFVMKHFERLPKIKRLYFEIEKPILEVCVDMEQHGFLLDAEFSKEYENELAKEIDILKIELETYFGDINLNSPAQLSALLYDELKLPDVSKKRSTDAKTLKKLAKYHKGVETLLKYRDLNKLLTTYIEPLPLKVCMDDGRLHGTFNQVDTATGRFASRSPNLQNLPYTARKMIVAPKGKVIIGIDFSQVEPRVLSHMANDAVMIDAYVHGRDLYKEMAMRVFNLEEQYCVDGAYDPTHTFKPRKRIKAVLLGIMYGMGTYTLAERIESTEEEAEAIIKDFFETYPAVKKFIDETHAEAERQEFVETMFGRKRRFVGHRQIAKRYHAVCKRIDEIAGYHVENISKFLREDRKRDYEERLVPYSVVREYYEVSGQFGVVERQSVNTKIQGSSADIMKKAMIRVYEVCKKYGYKILATVHDEVLIEVDENITLEQVEELENAMLGAVELRVPLKCDTDFMYRWGVLVSKSEWFAGKRPAKDADIHEG